jgi:hypothetical protein
MSRMLDGMDFKRLWMRRLDRAHRVDGIYVDNLSRLVWILREKYPKVLEADRRFEEETNFRNKVGTNNLVDALSHIGTLFEAAHAANYEQQRAQVTLFEDHLRRTMMEAWEQMLTFQAGEIDKLWYEDYLEVARPLQNSGVLHGSPSAEQLDTRRKRYVRLLDEGRNLKRGLDWPQWEEGTDKLIQACSEASELREMLHESVKAAEAHRANQLGLRREEHRHLQMIRRDTGSKVLAVAALLVAIAAGLGLGALLGVSSPSKGTTVHASGPAHVVFHAKALSTQQHDRPASP